MQIHYKNENELGTFIDVGGVEQQYHIINSCVLAKNYCVNWRGAS